MVPRACGVRNTGSEWLRILRDQIIVDSVLQGSEDDNGSSILDLDLLNHLVGRDELLVLAVQALPVISGCIGLARHFVPALHKGKFSSETRVFFPVVRLASPADRSKNIFVFLIWKFFSYWFLTQISIYPYFIMKKSNYFNKKLKLWFSNPCIFATSFHRLLIFQLTSFVNSNCEDLGLANLCLCQRLNSFIKNLISRLTSEMKTHFWGINYLILLILWLKIKRIFFQFGIKSIEQENKSKWKKLFKVEKIHNIVWDFLNYFLMHFWPQNKLIFYNDITAFFLLFSYPHLLCFALNVL